MRAGLSLLEILTCWGVPADPCKKEQGSPQTADLQEVPGSYISPIPWDLSPTSCQHPLPKLPRVAVGPGLYLWFHGMGEGLFFILEGHLAVMEKENKPPKEGLCFGWGFQIAHTSVR